MTGKRMIAWSLAVVALAGCGSAGGMEPAARTGPVVVLADEDIAGIVVSSMEKESDAAFLATERATREDVHQFALRMIHEHDQAMARLMRVLEDEEIDPAEGPLGAQLGTAGSALAELRDAWGPDFDRMFLAQQIADHEELIALLDRTLIAAADDDELEAELRMLRADFQRHLDMAVELCEVM